MEVNVEPGWANGQERAGYNYCPVPERKKPRGAWESWIRRPIFAHWQPQGSLRILLLLHAGYKLSDPPTLI